MKPPSRAIVVMLLVSLAVALTVIGGASGVTASGGPERLHGADARSRGSLSKRIQPVTALRDPGTFRAVGPDAALASLVVADRPVISAVVTAPVPEAEAPRYLAPLGRPRSRAPPRG